MIIIINKLRSTVFLVFTALKHFFLSLKVLKYFDWDQQDERKLKLAYVFYIIEGLLKVKNQPFLIIIIIIIIIIIKCIWTLEQRPVSFLTGFEKGVMVIPDFCVHSYLSSKTVSTTFLNNFPTFNYSIHFDLISYFC